MQINTAIFDMDGLLINSEPFWQEAGVETLGQFSITLSVDEYHQSLGLRTKEWLEYWFTQFNIDKSLAAAAEDRIVAKAREKIQTHAEPLEGIAYILSFFKEKGFKIGLATSSPMSLIDVVVDKLKIRGYFDAFASAEALLFSKPHPEVYLFCASLLERSPLQCLCFEDSFNGMVAAKSARMKCVVVPEATHYDHPGWGAADMKLHSLLQFDESTLCALD